MPLKRLRKTLLSFLLLLSFYHGECYHITLFRWQSRLWYYELCAVCMFSVLYVYQNSFEGFTKYFTSIWSLWVIKCGWDCSDPGLFYLMVDQNMVRAYDAFFLDRDSVNNFKLDNTFIVGVHISAQRILINHLIK